MNGKAKIAWRRTWLLAGLLGCVVAGGLSGPRLPQAEAASGPLMMPDWSAGQACVEEWRVGAKKTTRTVTLADMANGRYILNQSVDDGTSNVIEIDQRTFHVYRDVALANGQKLEFTPAYKFAEYPLEPGRAWEHEVSIKGESFVVQVKTKFKAGRWEKVKVPGGEFEAIKVVGQESIKGKDFSGSGKLTFWLAPGVPCSVKAEYSNSFGEKGSKQLLSFKAG